MQSLTKNKIRVFLWAVAIILLLVFLNNIFTSNPVERLVFTVLSPFSKMALDVSGVFVKIINFATTIKDLSLENNELKKENAELKAKIINLSSTEEENRLLRQQLDFQEKQQATLKEADIVSYDPYGFSHYVTLNKGLKDGISDNMTVITAGNILFGKIQKSHDRHSQVMLISDQNNKVNVKTESLTASGVLNGNAGGNMLLMDLIEREAVIKKDDLVLTSGLDGIYPKDIIVGKITEIAPAGEGVFKQAYVAPAYSGIMNTKVFVIVPPR